MNDLKNAFQKNEVVKRLKELENLLDHNQELNQRIDALKEKQKQMVNAKFYNQKNQYEVYLKEYQNLYDDVLNFPFVEEYLDYLEEANSMLIQVSSIIEKKINDALYKER
ncbi:MAG: YlbF family regulator [Anaeroplasmataceae bacterium]|nr:YlbF family regulator [Anaeroplasmataceae bacterium]